MLGVTWAEAKAVRTFIVGTVCPKVSKAMTLKAGLPVVGVVRLQWGESELVIQDSSCALLGWGSLCGDSGHTEGHPLI